MATAEGDEAALEAASGRSALALIADQQAEEPRAVDCIPHLLCR